MKYLQKMGSEPKVFFRIAPFHASLVTNTLNFHYSCTYLLTWVHWSVVPLYLQHLS